MDIKKKVVPNNHLGEPITRVGEREFIFFKVKFNNFRDVSGSTANEVTDREVWDECECCLCLPENYSDSGEPTQLAIYCHGAGGRVCEETNMIGGVTQILPCVDAGYAALDVNGARPDGKSMGNFEHINALYKAYKHVVKNYNVTDRIVLSGESMGGQTAWNFANVYSNIVLTVGLFYPRLNIEGVTVGDHYCIGTWDKPGTPERIVQNFHFPTNEWCEENLIGFHPYKNRSFVNNEGERVVIPPCPVKIWQGTDDKTVDPVMVEEFFRSIRRSGSYAEFHKLEGVGHRANDAMRKELLMWFNRFN